MYDPRWPILRLEMNKMLPGMLTEAIFATDFQVQHVNAKLLDINTGKVIKTLQQNLYLAGKSIVLDPEFLDDYTKEEIAASCLHVLLYRILRHEKRFKEKAIDNELNRYLWNCASEFARTSLLRLVNVPVPNFFLSPENYGFIENLSVEQYYDILCDLIGKMKKQIMPGAATNSNESEKSEMNASFSGSEEFSEQESESDMGSDLESNLGPALESDLGSDLGSDLEYDEDFMQDLQDEIYSEKFLNHISSALRGCMSSSGELKSLRRLNNPEEYNIIRRLRSIIEAIAFGGIGQRKRIGRPRRRNPIPQVCLLDSLRAAYDRVAVLVDVSGSLEEYRNEVYTTLLIMVKAFRNIDVYIGDTVFLDKVKHVKTESRLMGLPSGGGTDMRHLMKELDKLGYDSIIVITDAITPWPDAPLESKCYVFLAGEGAYYKDNIPEWIHVL